MEETSRTAITTADEAREHIPLPAHTHYSVLYPPKAGASRQTLQMFSKSPETVHFSSTAIVWKFPYNLTRGCLLLQVLQTEPAPHGLGGPSSCTNHSLVEAGRLNFTRTFPKERLTTSWHLFDGVEMLLEVMGICGAARTPRMTAARKAAAEPARRAVDYTEGWQKAQTIQCQKSSLCFPPYGKEKRLCGLFEKRTHTLYQERV
ncbi:uncharacterized protein LOC118246651 [Cygnus atratus]|uniref:uncharacterized protein LOC118246651 n=1 Tax=Cygnus atratus TaxID=8868 RepID=UPI0021B80048|nr:uncharacterized protein LOC118246651 [Cygnus atratus]